ncbi:hypothetical protein JANAI62_19340 [Jannaschia pagri]|uniref:Lipopolysaccharide export system protein LptC n=1 Tax=Jannaschia pagri TaxID=2829797 RepID=A0ABQ4NLT5_9RHOB|nr:MULTISPECIES: LPS export ABC transporter periplasmic protein LptC [unclassified Jannaschia]GIT91477.1 hypothetical protein JANAI61_19350 [Jannaschia sp. AI_61]GIT95311.1 hypothetical protein JANAI62_19340 [Jannaschia sp. AI_62]
MVADRHHTRLIKGARILLPVGALILLSTLFLLARTVNPDDAIPFADVDVSLRAKDQQLTSPRFSGVSRNGTEFALTAQVAKPDPKDARKMTAQEIQLTLVGREVSDARVAANTGLIDTATRTVTLTGEVEVETSTGFSLTTPHLQGSLSTLSVTAREGVTGTGPLGRLNAREMHLSEDSEGRQRLLFTGGVDLLYVPPVE